MNEWMIEATLFGGPFDGRTVRISEAVELLHMPVPPPEATLDSLATDLDPTPTEVTYQLLERKRLDLTPAQAFMRGVPEHRTVAATYRYRCGW